VELSKYISDVTKMFLHIINSLTFWDMLGSFSAFLRHVIFVTRSALFWTWPHVFHMPLSCS